MDRQRCDPRTAGSARLGMPGRADAQRPARSSGDRRTGAEEAQVGAAELEALAIAPHVPELFFCRDLQGYGWCVRKGQYLNVGLGRFDPRSLPAATDRFVSFLEKTDRIPPHFPWRWRGHSYAVNAAPRGRVIDDGVVLIGDAAGQGRRCQITS